MNEEEKAPSEVEAVEDLEETEKVPEDELEESPRKQPEEEKQKEGEDLIEEGNFVLVEMTGRSIETGEVFDTTYEEIAKEEGIYEEEKSYGPKLVVVGESWVLKGLDDRLAGLKLGETAKVEIPPDEAFGERSPENVRTTPYRMLRSKGINPVVGQQVEIDGRSAMVRSVGAGRVQLDYNHPLAGRKIVYEVKATERYEDDGGKIRALIGRRFRGIDLDLFKLKKLKTKVKIEIPDEIFFGENLQIAKRGVAL
ncbi:MAG: FKBP-type peptidyl-prolyl cis-trans isomerase, partial [Candidatus Bathyarchaeota archaeon]